MTAYEAIDAESEGKGGSPYPPRLLENPLLTFY